jgi:hypothetical protein
LEGTGRKSRVNALGCADAFMPVIPAQAGIQ